MECMFLSCTFYVLFFVSINPDFLSFDCKYILFAIFIVNKFSQRGNNKLMWIFVYPNSVVLWFLIKSKRKLLFFCSKTRNNKNRNHNTKQLPHIFFLLFCISSLFHFIFIIFLFVFFFFVFNCSINYKSVWIFRY